MELDLPSLLWGGFVALCLSASAVWLWYHLWESPQERANRRRRSWAREQARKDGWKARARDVANQ